MPYPVAAARGRASQSNLPYTDTFDRADGAIGNGWTCTAGLWTIVTNAALGAPGLGADAVTNGNMETGSPPASWTAYGGSTLTSAADERTGGTGTKSINVATGTAAFSAYQTLTLTPHTWYRYSGWGRKIGAVPQVGLETPADEGGSYQDSASWNNLIIIIRATQETNTLWLYDNGGEARYDDQSVRSITLADMICSRDLGTPNVDISIPLTLTARQPAGIVIGLDSAASPANFLLALHDGTQARLAKCVAGTYTSLIGINAAYGAGQTLRLRRSGSTVQLFYNGSQVGTDQTVSDALILAGTRHGMFTTASTATFASFSAVAP